MNYSKSFSVKPQKKIFSLAAAAVLAISALPFSASAAEATVGDFTIEQSYYTPDATIIEYTGDGGAVTLPEKATVGGSEYTVEVIGGAFTGNKKITSVTIPEGYTTINSEAFQNCTNLESINIPGSVTSIGANAFEGCTSLKSVTFDADTADSLSLRSGVFLNCTALTTINLPVRLDSVDDNFTRGCTSLTSVSIGEGAESFVAADGILYDLVTYPDEAALAIYPFGKGDTQFTVPQSVNGVPVTAVGPMAFRGNSTLQKVTLPSSVTTLERYAFEGMTAIQELVIETESVPTLGSSVCTNMAAGSKITVKNDEVAKVFEPQDWYTYYTPENTSVTVSGSQAAQTVEAAFSIAAEQDLQDGSIVYHIYADNAANVNTVIFTLSMDASQVEEGSLSIADSTLFDISNAKWETEGGKLTLTAYLGKTGNVVGNTILEKTEIATVTVPVREGVSGTVAASLASVSCAGVTNIEEEAKDGTATITPPGTAEFLIANYDVNNDGAVDIVDITEAQRYYQSDEESADWETAQKMDVNGDKVIDIQDYIEIFNHLDAA